MVHEYLIQWKFLCIWYYIIISPVAIYFSVVKIKVIVHGVIYDEQ